MLQDKSVLCYSSRTSAWFRRAWLPRWCPAIVLENKTMGRINLPGPILKLKSPRSRFCEVLLVVCIPLVSEVRVLLNINWIILERDCFVIEWKGILVEKPTVHHHRNRYSRPSIISWTMPQRTLCMSLSCSLGFLTAAEIFRTRWVIRWGTLLAKRVGSIKCWRAYFV